jgi:hypothetical protein
LSLNSTIRSSYRNPVRFAKRHFILNLTCSTWSNWKWNCILNPQNPAPCRAPLHSRTQTTVNVLDALWATLSSGRYHWQWTQWMAHTECSILQFWVSGLFLFCVCVCVQKRTRSFGKRNPAKWLRLFRFGRPKWGDTSSTFELRMET